MAQFVSYSGPGNSPIYYQPTLFSPEPPFGGLYGYGMWQKVGPSGGQSNQEVKVPERSMVAEYYANRQPYTQFAAQQAPLSALGYNPSMANLYSPSTSSLYSTGSSLLAPSTSGTSYGAGRYLSGSGLLGSPISFAPSNTTSNVSTP